MLHGFAPSLSAIASCFWCNCKLAVHQEVFSVLHNELLRGVYLAIEGGTRITENINVLTKVS